MRLVVDVEAERVLIGSEELRNQWVDFYAILTLARTHEETSESFVGADTIFRTGPWRHKVPASVGKEVARHLSMLDEKSLGTLIASRGKTRSWRLTVPPRSIRFMPSREEVARWVESRSVRPRDENAWVVDLRRLVEATLFLYEGKAEQALSHLEQPVDASMDPAVEAWASLIRGRAAYRCGDEELLSSLHEVWLRRADGPGRTVSAKLRALVSARNRFEKPDAVLRTLSRLAAELELRGDTAALGSVVNVMGLLARRAGHPAAAMAHHLRAAVLLGITGDYPSLEGALMNLANCRREALQKANQPIDEAVFMLVELARLVCSRLGVGIDSAQTEVAAAQWALEAGDSVRARYYLREAESIVERAGDTFDNACFHFARARIEHASPDGSSDPIKDMRIARNLFEEAGDRKALAETNRLLKQYLEEKRK
ncbi:hypothetical protein [Sorangium sp. So ce1389]|uniref:hypothetical protein n=1 Tax=Sorangium sp. So ce1389 TaxID=3133336 RepID=UPI003F641A52